MRRLKWLMVLGIAGMPGLGRPGGGRAGRARGPDLRRRRADDRIDPAGVVEARGPARAECGRVESPVRRPARATCRPMPRREDEAGRLTALNRVYEISAALGTVAWPPGGDPAGGAARVAAAAGPPGLGPPAAERDGRRPCRRRAIRPSRPTGRAGSTSSANDLGEALRDYDAAETVAAAPGGAAAAPRGARVARPAEPGAAEPGADRGSRRGSSRPR